MRKNYSQTGSKGPDDRTYLEGDWYNGGLSSNIRLAQNVYIDTSYGFAAFHSIRQDGLFIDEASGCYDRASFIVAETGKVSIGRFCILNGSTLICKNNITVGDHCMLAWGVVLTDSWMDASAVSIEVRRKVLTTTAQDQLRRYPFFDESAPVVLEDNCWVGFDAVVLPGVRLGRGSVVGCKTVVAGNVPPYAVVAGNPAKIVKYLSPDDTYEAKQKALKECII